MVQVPIKLISIDNFYDIKALKTKVMIYPTDTVYGIGCSAENKKLVERIFAIKGRNRKKPMSVIAPNKEWILEHCIVSGEILDKYLPGKYTLLLMKKNPEFLKHVTANSGTLGVRIPAHPFSKLVEKANIPFVTTSANLSGEKPAKSISEIPKKVLDAVDLVIDGGALSGIPSAIVDCRSGEDIIIKRA
ncbi:Threonylcarbamoyl-AMP synthase [uncultured archaeon]|nr:Threonylcarbamoyl-AMP synthase [uncultured archaeon]